MFRPQIEQSTSRDPTFQKVELEVKDLKWKVGRLYRVAQVGSILTVMVAIIALVLSLRQFNVQQEREFKKPIREKQLTLEFELSDVASRIATLQPDDIERKKAESRFRELYWGPMAYAEDRELLKWIVDFGNCLDDYDRARKLERAIGSESKAAGCATAEQQENRLKDLLLTFAGMRRSKLGLEWDIQYEEIYKQRAQNANTASALP